MVVDHADAHGYANDFIRDIAARADCLPDDPPDVVNLRELFQGRFDIWDRVATGGQGRVYQASRVGDDSYERIAIKLLVDGPLASDQARQRFMHEIDLASRLDHPGIVPILESGEIANRYFFTMPFIYGAPIDDYALVQESSVRDRVTLIAKAARALVAAHLGGVIHRDLKPSNILVDYKTHEPYILDFGLAKELRQEAVTNDPSSISLTGQVVGTLPYFSPEQAAGGSGKVDVRSDVYTLGLVLYRLLTARFPYDIDGDRDAVLHNIRQQDAMPLQKALALAFEAKRDKEPNYISDSHTINEDLNRIVRKALNKEPERRYQSMAAFADDLECYLRGGAVEAKADTAMYLLRKAVRRNKALFITVAVALLFAFGGLGLTALHYRREANTAAIAQAALRMSSNIELGSVSRDAGRTEKAFASYNLALALGESISRADTEVMRHLYRVHHRLAELYLSQEDVASARKHNDKALEVVQWLVGDAPSDRQFQRLQGLSLELQGRLHMANKSWESAIASFTESEYVHSKLASNGSIRALFDMAIAIRKRANAYRALKDFPKARNGYQSFHRIMLGLHESEPDNSNYVIEMARIEAKRGSLCLVERMQASDEESRTFAGEAVEWFDKAERSLSALSRLNAADELREDINGIREGIDANRAYLARHP